jgi:hypothetical protein
VHRLAVEDARRPQHGDRLRLPRRPIERRNVLRRDEKRQRRDDQNGKAANVLPFFHSSCFPSSI